MTWVRLDDNFTEHPKVLAAGPEAAWAFVRLISYANRLNSDGFIPSAAASTFAGKRLTNRLVTAGLLAPAPGGYSIHDYLDFQPSRREVLARREAVSKARAEAGRAGGLATAAANVQQTDSNRVAPSRPVPVPIGNAVSQSERTVRGGRGLRHIGDVIG